MCHCRIVEASVYACWMEPDAQLHDIGSTVVARAGPGSARESASQTKERRNPNPFAIVLRSFGSLAPPTNTPLLLHHSITPTLRRSAGPFRRRPSDNRV